MIGTLITLLVVGTIIAATGISLIDKASEHQPPTSSLLGLGGGALAVIGGVLLAIALNMVAP